jgi:putative oxidoreductase
MNVTMYKKSTMNQVFNHPMWNTHALLLARVLMGGFFLLAGIGKVSGIDGVAGMIGGTGLPAPLVLAWLTALLEIAAGAAIILGKYFKEAAITLAIFTFVISFIFHGPNSWAEDMMQQLMFMKNMAIVAGLLFMAAHGAGNTWKIK